MQYYRELLTQFLAFQSISTDSKFVPEIHKTVAWLKNLFSEAGFTTQVLEGKTCNPVVFASYEVAQDAEWVLVYGHYDVQPAAQSDGWYNDPFSLYEAEGRFYARGVVDNKGQVLIHIATVLDLIKQGKLKYNVKFLIEGNEETSNADMATLVAQNKALLSADYAIISDGEIIADYPVIEYSLRGGFNITLRIKTLANNLHSGIYGGTVPNALYEASKFLGGLFDSNNRVAVTGFYDNVDVINDDQLKSTKVLSAKIDLLGQTGAKETKIEEGLDYFSQTGLRPTISVTSVKGGYQGEGYANIVPATADIKLNFRTVASQDTQQVLANFQNYLKVALPSYVAWEVVHIQHPYSWVKVDISSEKVQETKKLLEESFGKEVLFKPVGGGIPVVSDFKETLGLETLLVSLGNDDCNMHGVNENFKIELIEKGLDFSRKFFSA